MNFFKSKTAIVKDATIGKGTKIWEYANIYGCQIGDGCNIGSYVEIQNEVTIGNNVTVSTCLLYTSDAADE